MNLDRMDELFREVCNLKEDIMIDDEMSSDTVASWDSFANMQLITKLEENFHIQFEFDELLNIENWGDFKKIVKGKVNK